MCVYGGRGSAGRFTMLMNFKGIWKLRRRNGWKGVIFLIVLSREGSHFSLRFQLQLSSSLSFRFWLDFSCQKSSTFDFWLAFHTFRSGRTFERCMTKLMIYYSIIVFSRIASLEQNTASGTGNAKDQKVDSWKNIKNKAFFLAFERMQLWIFSWLFIYLLSAASFRLSINFPFMVQERNRNDVWSVFFFCCYIFYVTFIFSLRQFWILAGRKSAYRLQAFHSEFQFTSMGDDNFCNTE